MVQPKGIHPNGQVNDITREFRNAATRLLPGKLVKDEDFTLFEAVSALEIGDPKMDSGCSTFDSAGEEEFDPARPMTAEEIIWLMDELLYREVAWQMGYPLSQTVFTSIHIERLLWPQPKQLTDARFSRDAVGADSPHSLLVDVFQPYCIGLIKCCDLVLSMVTSQHYYEEEDFATQTFNRPLLHEFAVGEIIDMLQDARSKLVESDLPSPLARALNIRLEVRSAFLSLLHTCAYHERSAPPELERLIEFVDTIENSVALGKPTSTAAFTLKIQRRLASSVPPRPMIVIEKGKAFVFVRQLLTDTITAFQMLDVSSSSDLLVAYQNFMAQSTQPAVYVRALAQSFLNINTTVVDRFTVKNFVTSDIRSLVHPNDFLFDQQDMDHVPEDQQIEVGSRVDLFVNRCGQSFLNLFRTLCLNRCRVRRTMCHAALEWDQIQAEAEELDAVVQTILGERAVPFPADEEPTYSYSFSSWVYHHKLFQLRTILQTGFDLSVYASHELPGMYWYLSFLTSTHLNHLERISFFVAAERSSASKDPGSEAALKQLYRHFTWLKATEAMAQALHRIFTVLQRNGHFPEPVTAYASRKLRYELRMRPFLHVSIPEPINMDVARRSASLQGLRDETMVEQASVLIQTARKAWDEVLKAGWNCQPMEPATINSKADKPTPSVVEREWTQDVRNSIKTCIGVGIVIVMLKTSLREGTSSSAPGIKDLKVEIPPVGDRDRWHRSWPVPKIQS